MRKEKDSCVRRGYLTDTCLTEQGKYKEYLDSFGIEY